MKPSAPPCPQGPKPTPARKRALYALAPALALTSLAHCTFPEYSFRVTENAKAGSGGSSPSAGRGGSGGGGGPAAGDGGAAGAGGCGDCEFVVPTTEGASIEAVFTDGTTVFWTEFNPITQRSGVFAHPAGPEGETRAIVAPGDMPSGELFLKLTTTAGDPFLYGISVREEENPDDPDFPLLLQRSILRAPKEGKSAPPEVFVNAPGETDQFFLLEAGENSLHFLLDDDGEPPGNVFRTPKDDSDPFLVVGQVFGLVGVGGEDAIIIDGAKHISRARRDSRDDGLATTLLFSDELDQGISFTFDEQGYYFLLTPLQSQFSSVVRLPLEGGGADELDTLSQNEPGIPLELQASGGHLYWLSANEDTPVAALRTVPTAGGSPASSLVTNAYAGFFGSRTLSVGGGIAFYVSFEQNQRLIGRRVP